MRLLSMLPLLAAAACTTDPGRPTPLKDRDFTMLDITARLDPTGHRVEITADSGDICIDFEPDTRATMGTLPMVVQPGYGWSSFAEGSGCDRALISLTTPDDPAGAITISDKTATWTIDVPDLFSHSFTLSDNYRLTWNASTAPDAGELVATRADGVATYDEHGVAKDGILAFPRYEGARPAHMTLTARRPIKATQCDGWIGCIGDVTIVTELTDFTTGFAP